MDIPEGAIEAAAKAIHRHDVREGLSSTYAPNEYHRNEARAALEAAAPFIAAQALRDAASTIYDYIKAGADDPVSPDETAVWLLARADSIEAGN